MLQRVALSITCALAIGALAALAVRIVVRVIIAAAGREFTAAQRYRLGMYAFFAAGLVYVGVFVRLLSGAEITAQTASIILSNTTSVPSAALMRLARVSTLLAVGIAALWAGVAMINTLRLFRRAAVTARMCDAGDADHSLHRAVARVARRMHVATPRVVISREHTVPAIVGAWSPALVLPHGMTAMMSPAHIDLIIAHELAHIIRRDTVVNTAQACVEMLFFFCPSMRALSRHCRDERELAADALAADTFHAPLVLARALERLETARAHRPASLALAADDEPLLRRITALANAQCNTRDKRSPMRTAEMQRSDRMRLIAANAVVAIVAVVNIAAIPGNFVDDALRLTVPAAAYRQDIRAHDDAGPFTLRVVGYRAVAATFAGHSFPATHIRQRGNAVRFVGNDGATLLAVQLKPAGGMTWNSR